MVEEVFDPKEPVSQKEVNQMIANVVRRLREQKMQRIIDAVHASDGFTKETPENQAYRELVLNLPVEERVAYAAGYVLPYFYMLVDQFPNENDHRANQNSLATASVVMAHHAVEQFFWNHARDRDPLSPEHRAALTRSTTDAIVQGIEGWFGYKKDALIDSLPDAEKARIEESWQTFRKALRHAFDYLVFPKTSS